MYLNNIIKKENKKGFFESQSDFSYFNTKKEDNNSDMQQKLLNCLTVTIKNKEIITK